MSGALELEAPEPWDLVVPGPGGHRLAFFSGKSGKKGGAVLAPGEAFDGEPRRAFKQCLLCGGGATWASDGKSVVYSANRQVRRYVVESGEDQMLFSLPDDVAGLALSSDGNTVYYTPLVAHVRRHMITNLAERPPL